MIPREALELAGYYALREYLEGRALPPAETRAKIDVLFRPFRKLGGLLTPVLGLKEAIAELEAQFPAVREARAAHLTHVAPTALC